MALRIAGGMPEGMMGEMNMMQQEEEPQMGMMAEPEELAEEDPIPEPELEEPSAQEQGKVLPAFAVYRTPDLGPFMCGNCTYFREDGSCIIVAGQIDPEGMCNIFTPKEIDESDLLTEDVGTEQAPML